MNMVTVEKVPLERKTSAMHAAVRKVLQYHGLVKGSDGVVEADLIYAVLDAPSPPPPAEPVRLSMQEIGKLCEEYKDTPPDYLCRAVERAFIAKQKAVL